MFNGVSGKSVLITGGSGGLGAAMAQLFAASGANVGIHYNGNRKAAAKLVQDLQGSDGRVEAFQGNFLQSGACRQLIRQFIQRFGTIDVLINNAGGVAAGEFLTLSDAAWDATMILNAKAPFLLSREAFAHMKRSGGGRIINISSIGVKYGGSSKSLHYAAAKGALETLTIGFAKAGAPHRILVNAIRPGFVETPFHRKMNRNAKAKRIQLIPLHRSGQPMEIARMALFLASEGGDFVTGQIIAISGGD